MISCPCYSTRWTWHSFVPSFLGADAVCQRWNCSMSCSSEAHEWMAVFHKAAWFLSHWCLSVSRFAIPCLRHLHLWFVWCPRHWTQPHYLTRFERLRRGTNLDSQFGPSLELRSLAARLNWFGPETLIDWSFMAYFKLINWKAIFTNYYFTH